MRITESTGLPLSETSFRQVCEGLSIALTELWAVLTVETRGFGFLPDRRPVILFERHIFHSRTAGRFDATAPDISSKNSGGYIGGAGEYKRLEAAITLNLTRSGRRAALESTSWGLGQIMGFNHASAGFQTVEEMVAAMTTSEEAQLQGKSVV